MKTKMSKKQKLIVLITFVVVFVSLILTGCNKEIFDFKYEFNRIICNYNGDKFELKISKWTDYEGEQLQITAFDGKVYLLSANNCYMIDD